MRLIITGLYRGMPPKPVLRIDLEPYGMRLVLRPGISMEYEHLTAAKLRQGSFSQSQGRVDLESGTYSIGSLLGEGTYGKTYQIVHTVDNRVYVLKVMQLRSSVDMVNASIKEAIIHILLERESADQPDGPYVPRFYEIAFDVQRSLVLIRMERIHGSLDNVYVASTQDQNDIIVPETLGDIAHVLNFFHDRLKYNHRDLKSDNVGYIYKSDGKYSIKLIDFGMSCLTWNGVKVSGEQYFSIQDRCFIPSRDLTQYIYEIMYSFKRYFSKNLQKLLKEMLTFPLNNTTCRLLQGCRYRGYEVKTYLDIYDFLNQGVKNPKGEPKNVYERMMRYLGQDIPKYMTPVPSIAHDQLVPVKQCMPEQIYNPKTRRCVRRDGAVGRKIMRDAYRRTPTPIRGHSQTRKKRKDTTDLKPCKPYQTRNPVTRRCRYSCASSQIRNPATGRCVSRAGPVGRVLRQQGVRTSPTS